MPRCRGSLARLFAAEQDLPGNETWTWFTGEALMGEVVRLLVAPNWSDVETRVPGIR
jgi:hypothetical protein